MKSLLNFSGGKDSVAMLYLLKEQGIIPDTIVFADTEKEFPEMYSFFEKVEKDIGRKITRLKPKNSFEEWFYGTFTKGKFEGRIRGFPYVISPCWFQREGKVKQLDKFFKENEFDIVYIGLNADEKENNER